MTRINLVKPSELTDQHLLAEYRELPRVFWIVKKKLQENKEINPWNQFTLWTWHVIFFYDKLLFLEKRFKNISLECKKRGFNIKYSDYDISDIPNKFKKNYKPELVDLKISRERLKIKIEGKKWFYKMYWKLIDK
jgi:deoxyribonuclease (pyrimidine dimer)